MPSRSEDGCRIGGRGKDKMIATQRYDALPQQG